MRDFPYRPMNQRGIVAETLQNLIMAFVIVLVFAGMYYYQNHASRTMVNQNLELRMENTLLEHVVQQQELSEEIRVTTDTIEETTTKDMVVQEKATQVQVVAIKKKTAQKVQTIQQDQALSVEEKHIAKSQVMVDQLREAYCMADPDLCPAT